MSDNEQKYPAPALAKGLQVIETLQQHGPMILEELAGTTAISKASLLRIADTLIMLGAVERDAISRKYQATVKLIAVNGIAHDKEQLIHSALVQLSAQTGLTTEWYIQTADGMMIIDRVEPLDKPVKVVANIGYIRHLKGEFEAVARIAIANKVKIEPDWNQYWNYLQGEIQKISRNEFNQLLTEATDAECVMDDEYNPNGIRRMAAGVKDSNGKLYGIIALAESFTPDANSKTKERLAALQQISQKLELKLRTDLSL
jgi:DNA-binding IclR family transcriptional regulator